MHFSSCSGIHVLDSGMDKTTKVKIAIPEKMPLRSERFQLLIYNCVICARYVLIPLPKISREQ